MMSSTVNIVEVIGGEYKLNRKELSNILSLAQNCESIAIISIIGLKFKGKSFLMNCLMSYLESNNSRRNNWPNNLVLAHDYGFHDDNNKNTNPVIQLCSRPFILKSGSRNVAIFLMDSSQIFTDHVDIQKTKLMKDTIGLFMNTSSTIIHVVRNSFKSQELIKFRDCLEKDIHKVDKFQELFFFIQDWNSAEKEHLLGSKGGKVYFEDVSKGLDFSTFFTNIECYLMPPPGENVIPIDKNLSSLNSQFNVQLSQMILNKLLNSSEMEIKKKPQIDQHIKADELIELFENYVKRLNSDTDDDDINRLSYEMSQKTTDSREKIAFSLDDPGMHVDETHYEIDKNDNKLNYENFDETQSQILNNFEHLLNELRAGLENAVMDPNFNFLQGSLKVFDAEMLKSISAFHIQFKNKISLESYEYYENGFRNKTNLIKDQFKGVVDDRLKELQREYSLEMHTSIDLYDKKMRALISRHLEESSQNLDLDQKNIDQIQLSSLELFENEVKEINGFNTNLLIEFSHVLKDELNNKKKKYEKALDHVKTYKNTWKEILNKYGFINSSSLQRKQDELMKSMSLSLDGLEDEELKQISINAMKNVFTSIDKNDKKVNSENFEETQNQISNKFEHLLNELRASLENAVMDPNFNFRQGSLKVFDAEMLKSMSAFHIQFKNKIYLESYEYYENEFRNKTNLIKDQFNEVVDDCLKELQREYSLQKNTYIHLYDKKMRALISRHLDESSQNLDLDQKTIDQIQLSSLELFENEVKEINGFNTNLLIEFSHVLKDELDNKKKKYEKTLDLIKTYKNAWKEILNKYGFINSSSLQRKQDELMKSMSLSLDGLEDEELKQISINGMKNIFTSIDKNDKKVSSKNFEETQNQISNKFEHLLNELRAGLENAVMDPNFNFRQGSLKVFDAEMLKSMSAFHIQFKNKISLESYEYYENEFRNKTNLIKDQFKGVVDDRLKELQREYSLEMHTSIDLYDKKMRALISRHLEESSQNLDLDQKIIDQIEPSSLELFENEVKEINGFNTNLLIEFSHVLKDELNNKKKKYEKALNLIKTYKNIWKEILNKYRYINPSSLQKKQDELMKSISLSLDELEDEELKQISINAMKNIFTSIENTNKQIYNDEEALAEDVIGFVYNLFYQCLHNKLKSRFFSEDEVKTLYRQLLEHTLKTMITHCDFKKYQKLLVEKCEEDLRIKLDKKYPTFVFEYISSLTKAKTILKTARDEAIQMFNSEMKSKLAESFPYIRNEFEIIISELSKKAYKLNEDKTYCLKKDFDKQFFEQLVSENITYISEAIKVHQDKFNEHEQNKTNHANVSCISIYFGRFYLSAAYYDEKIQYILDKNGNNCRGNSIAFTEGILFGDEARAHYKKLDANAEPFDKSFDIKQLITKSRGNTTEKELFSYPFGFVGEKLRVKVNNKLINHDLAIESLIALQVLDIQSDAQKHLGKSVTKAVLTVPTHYNLGQRNAFKDAAKIAGLHEVLIISEMNAIAIWFAKDINRFNHHTRSRGFFVVINDYVIDVAVIEFKYINIEYKAYNHLNLKSDESTGRTMNFAKGSDTRQNENFESALKHLFDRTLNTSGVAMIHIDSIAITGDSIHIGYIKHFIEIYFRSKSSLVYVYPLGIVMEGSVQFIENMSRSRAEKINIQQFFLHRFSFEIRDKRNKLILKKNFQKNGVQIINRTQLFNLPVIISIFQDDCMVARYDFTYLPPTLQHQCYFTEIILAIGELGELDIKLKNCPFNRKLVKETYFHEIKLGLSLSEINEESSIIESLKSKERVKHEGMKEILVINQAKENLNDYYLKVKKCVESNTLLRGLKLKKMMQELEVTEKLLQSNNTEARTYAVQKLKLEKVFEILET